jgi:hypothetical protein
VTHSGHHRTMIRRSDTWAANCHSWELYLDHFPVLSVGESERFLHGEEIRYNQPFSASLLMIALGNVN